MSLRRDIEAWAADREAALAEHTNADGDITNLRRYDEARFDYGLDAADLLERLLGGEPL